MGCACGSGGAEAPDPKEIASAQTGSNIYTAIANKYLNNANIRGPDGSVTSTTSGFKTITDPSSGQTYQIPITDVEMKLSPQQLAIKAQQDAAKLKLAQAGAGMAQNYGKSPLVLGDQARESKLIELQRKRLDPQLAERQAATEQQLANRGIKVGSAAYDRSMRDLYQGQNDARNQMILNSRGTINNELLAEEQARQNRLGFAMNGGQPGAAPNPQLFPANIANTDVAGINQNAYQNQLQQQQGRQSVFGSLLGLAGSGILALSDDRTKKDKVKLGEIKPGMNLHAFRYKTDPKGQPLRLGLMASEVEKVKPEAVHKLPGGLRAVDYEKALEA